MIAVHNFHNAIEVVLRAVLLHHEVRGEKQLNIEFEAMLNDIDNHQAFRDSEIKLPYRQELRILNQVRNTVQHHGVEPAPSAMEDYRVFTRRFLGQACRVYFEVEFESLSPLDMVEDAQLRELLRLALLSIEEHDVEKSLGLSKVAFTWASEAVWSFLPYRGLQASRLLATRVDSQFRDYEKRLDTLADDVHKAEYYAALLSSGVGIVDYKRFESSTPSVTFFGEYHTPVVHWAVERAELDEEAARWVQSFVVNAVVAWQVSGLAPCIPHRSIQEAQTLIQEVAQGGWG